MRVPKRKQPKYADTSPPDRDSSPEESWEHVASWYDALAGDQGTEFHQEVIIPGLLRLLKLQPGEQVLDMACGQGAVSRALDKAGARVTGVDLSPRLVKMARQSSSRAIKYLVGNARHLEALSNESFDAIVCILAAQNMDPIEPVFAECSRLLRRGGRLVTVITHPAFRIPRQSSWRWDQERKLLYRAVDRYLTPLKVPVDTHPFRMPEKRITWTYHRPLQTYVNSMATAGLWTNCLEEWPSHKVSQPGPRARAENRARVEFPLFLALRAVRVPLNPSAQGQLPS